MRLNSCHRQHYPESLSSFSHFHGLINEARSLMQSGYLVDIGNSYLRFDLKSHSISWTSDPRNSHSIVNRQVLQPESWRDVLAGATQTDTHISFSGSQRFCHDL
jgi:hypothetical protein